MPRRGSLPASLHSAEVKLRRANLHKGIARREARRFFNRHPDPTFRIEPEGDEIETLGAVNRYRIILETGVPDLPESFAARFGDAIYNYRCALDHIAWQLVRHGSRWPLPDKARNAVQFPIYDTAGAFDSNHGRRLPGADRNAVAFIKARHKYARGDATNNALLGLARLSNDDKHRELHVFLGLMRSLKSNVTFTDCRHLTWQSPPVRPALKDGAVLTNLSIEVTGPNPKMKVELAPTAQIAIEDGRDFSEMLEGIRVEVTEILHAPEIIAGIS